MKKITRHRKTCGEDEQLWLTSYADLISAVMAVLILFVSFSKVDLEKMDSVNRLLHANKNCPSLNQIKKQLEQVAQTKSVNEHIDFILDREGLLTSLDSTVLFNSGKATLNPSVMRQYKEVMRTIAEVGKLREVDITGHTDDIPPKKGTNWMLASNRAIAMQTYLMSLGLPEKGTRLVAYSANKPKVAIQGLSGLELDQARAANRRVEVKIKKLKPDVQCD